MPGKRSGYVCVCIHSCPSSETLSGDFEFNKSWQSLLWLLRINTDLCGGKRGKSSHVDSSETQRPRGIPHLKHLKQHQYALEMKTVIEFSPPPPPHLYVIQCKHPPGYELRGGASWRRLNEVVTSACGLYSMCRCHRRTGAPANQ